jgi:hypothetical protein
LLQDEENTVLTKLSSNDYKFGQIDFRAEFISQPLSDFSLDPDGDDDGDPFGGGGRDHDGLSSLNLPSFTDTYTTKSVITTIEPRAFGAEAEYENRLRAGAAGLRRHYETTVSVTRSFKTSFEALLQQQHSSELKVEETSPSSVGSEASSVYGETSVDTGGHQHQQQVRATTVIIPPMSHNRGGHRQQHQQPMTQVGLSMVMMTTPSSSCSSSARSTASGGEDGSSPPPVAVSPSSSSSSTATASTSSLSHLLPSLTVFDTFLQHHEEHGLRQRSFEIIK